MITVPNTYTKPDSLPIQLITPPINPEWRERLNDMWWSSSFNGILRDKREDQIVAKNRVLIDAILQFGGQEVCMPMIEEDLLKLQTRGVFAYGDKAVMQKGGISQCHSNSCDLWESNPAELVIMTGYALSEDGIWRQHSWCARIDDGTLIETTEPRIAYFGFAMTIEEAEKFVSDNW